MRSAVFTEYGRPEVLQIQQVDKPVPRDDQVLIKVHATTVTTAECLMRRGCPRWGRVIIGLWRPRKRMRVMGLELAGTASLAHKPANTTFEQAAAAVDGATTALFFLRTKVGLASGQSLGADKVIDYTVADFTRGDQAYDVIFDTVGRSSLRRCRRVLATNGRYIATTGLRNAVLAPVTSLLGGRRVITGMSADKRESLPIVREMVESGRLRVVVDRSYPFEQLVQAHHYVDQGHKTGNVTVLVAS
ncbi:NAD(P)-dependent alcohol dehydrogenase [Solwaraspora sp. WMMB335]|uniref:NAD(P)-dependent alcohol dehydrogenase n=1 Tax=Solwaraspora sp. WMMB335 TaxID=3404118 RepID=UPI003B94E114